MSSSQYRRRRLKKKNATSVVFIVMLIIVLSLVGYLYWDSHRTRFYDDLPSNTIIGLGGDSEEDAIGPQYSDEKRAFIERLNQMMRIQLELDTIE